MRERIEHLGSTRRICECFDLRTELVHLDLDLRDAFQLNIELSVDRLKMLIDVADEPVTTERGDCDFSAARRPRSPRRTPLPRGSARAGRALLTGRTRW